MRSRTPNWITTVFSGIGEMTGQPNLNPDPAAAGFDVRCEADELGRRRAYINLVKSPSDVQL